jgi:hypothetical protein
MPHLHRCGLAPFLLMRKVLPDRVTRQAQTLKVVLQHALSVAKNSLGPTSAATRLGISVSSTRRTLHI